MRIPFLQPRRRDYALEPLRITDSPAVSLLHREDFVRPWTDGEFAALLEQDTVFGYAARETGQGAKPPVGFVLARLAAGEPLSALRKPARLRSYLPRADRSAEHARRHAHWQHLYPALGNFAKA